MALDGEKTTQYIDNVLQNCTLENIYNFINQCHANKFNKNKLIKNKIKSCSHIICIDSIIWLVQNEVCPESIQPCAVRNRDIYWRRYKIQQALSIGQWGLSPLKIRHLGTSHSSPIVFSCPFVFSWISLTVWNLFPSKGDFSFGKSQKSQSTKSRL